MLLASLFYLLQPAYAETKYILNIHYESGPIPNIKFEGYSEDADELTAASKSKENAYVKFKDYIDRNNITIIDSSAKKPIVSVGVGVYSFGVYEKITTIDQAYLIHSYDVGEIVCTTINGGSGYCKSKSQVLTIVGLNPYASPGGIIRIKKFDDKFIATGSYPHEAVVQITNIK
jgi:hypothetical protein